MKTTKQIVTTIEGIIALCLGSADRVVWVDQTNASAFSDGEKLYLPKVCGIEGEFELLLGIALREVARITHSDASVFEPMSGEWLGYATAIEDARLKQRIGIDYKGAASVFDGATSVMRRVMMGNFAEKEPDPEVAKQLAIWAAANDAYLDTTESLATANQFAEIAAQSTEPTRLAKSVGLAQSSPWLGCAAASGQVGLKIANLLVAVVQPPEQEAAQQPSGGSPDVPESQDNGQPEAGEQADQSEPEAGQGGEPGPTQGSGGDSQQEAPQQPSGGSSDVPESQDNGQPETGEQADQSEPEAGQGGEPGPTQGSGGDSQQDAPQQPSGGASDVPESQDNGQPETGDQADQAEPEAGQGDEPGPTQGSGSGGGQAPQSSNAEQSGLSHDALSNALAILKGHDGALAVSRPPSEQQQAGKLVDAELVKALEEAMAKDDAYLQLVEIAELQENREPADAAIEAANDDDALLLALFGTPLAGGGNAEEDHHGQNTLGPVPARLVSVLLRAFQDTRDKPQFRCASGRDLAVSHLWRLKRLGDTRIFRKKAPAAGIDAAVWLLLDRSLSMEDDIELAASATNAFALALQRISGVQTAISLFPGETEVTEPVLGFRQSCVHATAKLKTVSADGGTPTAEAILAILPELMKRVVERRIIILLTDGDPDSLSEAQDAIAKANEQGIEVIGIGIGQDQELKKLVPRSRSIKSVTELPAALEALFKDELNVSLLAA